MSIQSIKINNFRNVSNLDINFEDKKVLCFVGENGSSKTSVLSLILEGMLYNTQYDFKDIKALKEFRNRLINPDEIKSGEKFYSIEMHYQNIEKEEIIYKKIVLKDFNIKKDEYINTIDIEINESFFAETSNLNSGKKEFLNHNVLLDRPSYRHELYSMDLLSNEKEMGIELMEQKFHKVRPYKIKSISGRKNAEVLILNLFFDLYIGYGSRNWVKNKIIDILKMITGKEFGNIQISSSPYRKILFSNIGGLDLLSNGELEILVTITSIIEQQIVLKDEYSSDIDIFDISGIVLIDEIDLHLHPKAQERYLNVLTKIFKNIQFIVTTHSPFVIRGLPKESVVISLPSGREFFEDFSNMDIDSITNIIFDYDGRFSNDTNKKLLLFKELINSLNPDIQRLGSIYSELRNSDSAKNELKLYLSLYASNPKIIKDIIED